MDGDVSEFDDVGEDLPGVTVNGETEAWFVDECLDVVAVGGAEGFVCGIYPFDGKFQGFAGGGGRHGRGEFQEVFCVDGCGCEEFVSGVFGEEVEVAHWSGGLFIDMSLLCS